MSDNIERRYSTGTIEVRASDSGGIVLEGYALKYNKLSQNLGGFVERVLPGMFAKSLADGVDVLARYQHEDHYLLGRTSAGTLRVSSDDTGLPYDVDMPDTSYGRDLTVLAQRGDVRHSSFAFRTWEDDWSLTEQGFPLRSLVSGALVDVAPVVTPAYMDTTSGIRSLASKFDLSPDEIAEVLRDNKVATLFSAPAPVVIDLGSQRADESTSQEQGETHSALALARLRSELQLKRPI